MKNKRYTIFPIQHKGLWDRYIAARDQFWVPEEIDLSRDKWHLLKDKEKSVLELAIGFFVASDIIVNENIATTFLDKISESEAEFYYHLQLSMEDIHSHMYSLFVEAYIETDRRDKMFNAATEIPAVKKKTDWAKKWMESDSFEESMVAFACVEGLAFSVLFSLIFYFKDKDILPGLCKGNLLILKDEQSHYEFGVHYFKNYTDGLSTERIKEIILDCCEVEKQFAIDVIGDGLPGLTLNMMNQYIEFVTDGVLSDFGVSKVFNVSNPLQYMYQISLDNRSNFFETRAVNEYTRAAQSEVLFDEDF